ncbi:hypothetical protein [Rivularia sp. UHCC 0363]|uniref:hypothetical protein n=1 Tax=Rivularia sp. UHCC 0363 TaxID=3110244 RepID=UPI002B20DB7B|nr:hypothetical protein [Rivularia sp. UHCC 0363]MEA5595687.1 hypothetical protein [Rivularia sp. UHCC 0363]
MTLKASLATYLKHPTMNNFDYQEILELRNACDRVLDRAGKPDEALHQALLYKKVCLNAIKLGILEEFFKTYRRLLAKRNNNN